MCRACTDPRWPGRRCPAASGYRRRAGDRGRTQTRKVKTAREKTATNIAVDMPPRVSDVVSDLTAAASTQPQPPAQGRVRNPWARKQPAPAATVIADTGAGSDGAPTTQAPTTPVTSPPVPGEVPDRITVRPELRDLAQGLVYDPAALDDSHPEWVRSSSLFESTDVGYDPDTRSFVSTLTGRVIAHAGPDMRGDVEPDPAYDPADPPVLTDTRGMSAERLTALENSAVFNARRAAVEMGRTGTAAAEARAAAGGVDTPEVIAAEREYVAACMDAGKHLDIALQVHRSNEGDALQDHFDDLVEVVTSYGAPRDTAQAVGVHASAAFRSPDTYAETYKLAVNGARRRRPSWLVTYESLIGKKTLGDYEQAIYEADIAARRDVWANLGNLDDIPADELDFYIRDRMEGVIEESVRHDPNVVAAREKVEEMLQESRYILDDDSLDALLRESRCADLDDITFKAIPSRVGFMTDIAAAQRVEAAREANVERRFTSAARVFERVGLSPSTIEDVPVSKNTDSVGTPLRLRTKKDREAMSQASGMFPKDMWDNLTRASRGLSPEGIALHRAGKRTGSYFTDKTTAVLATSSNADNLRSRGGVDVTRPRMVPLPITEPVKGGVSTAEFLSTVGTATIDTDKVEQMCQAVAHNCVAAPSTVQGHLTVDADGMVRDSKLYARTSFSGAVSSTDPTTVSAHYAPRESHLSISTPTSKDGLLYEANKDVDAVPFIANTPENRDMLERLAQHYSDHSDDYTASVVQTGVDNRLLSLVVDDKKPTKFVQSIEWNLYADVDRPETIVHEMAHIHEFADTSIQAATHRWRNDRLAQHPPSPRTFSSSHQGWVTEGAFAYPYASRVYGVAGDDPSTEVFSVGMEKLSNDSAAEHLRKADPEHLQLTLGLLMASAR